MSNKQQIQSGNTTPSQLERFSLGFEYDKTIQQVRQEVRIRTI